MAIMKYLRGKFNRQKAPKPMEYIEEKPGGVDSAENKKLPEADLRQLESEIDLSPHQDLEDYARGLNVTQESIERWISSGLLMPEEMKVAEKLVKIMRRRS